MKKFIPAIYSFWVILFISNYSFAKNTSYLLYEEQIISDNRDIKFVKDQVYGDTDEVYMGRIWDIDVDSEGRVYITDMGNINIQVFNPDGSYSGSIGRQGRGPGEFLNITHHTQINIKSNKIYVTGTEWITSDKVQVFSINDFSLIDEIMFNESEKKEFNSDWKNISPRVCIQ